MSESTREIASTGVRLASVGLGWWGGVLADAVESINGAELVSCFARSVESRTEFAEQRGIPAAESLDEILDDETIDGIVLATSHISHSALIQQAARAGKNVFVEKPFTLTVEEAKTAIDEIERAGVVLQVGHNKRRHLAMRRLKRLIETGELGTVVSVESIHCGPMALDLPEGFWRLSRDESPLGSMTSLGVHALDTMHYLFGPVATVYAASKRMMEQPPIDHMTSLVLEFESGPLGYLGTSFVAPTAVTLSVRGTKGSAWSEQDATRFYRQDRSEKVPREEPIGVLDTIKDEMVEFVNAIDGGTPPETGGPEGLAVVAVLEAAVASSVSGKAESVANFL